MDAPFRIHSLLTGLMACSVLVCPAATPRYTVLHHFAGSDGANPSGPLVLSGSTLFGTTVGGTGVTGPGTVFRLGTDGSGFTVLKRFGADGANPFSGLTLLGGDLYGTTVNGGRFGGGTVFKIGPDGGGYQVVWDFTNSPSGTIPFPGPLVASGTDLYGSTENGGDYVYGTVYKMAASGGYFTTLQQFDWATKGGYVRGITLSGDTLYGTTRWGGSPGGGTVFKLQTDGSGFGVLFNFGSQDVNQSSANGGLIVAGTDLYGTTARGGNLIYGTAFKIGTGGGAMTTLAHFPTNQQPAAGMALAGDTLFGTTCGTQGGGNTYYGNGTLFMVRTNGTGYVVLRNFSGADGANSQAPPLFSDGTLCGTTTMGGAYSNGVVFSMGLGPKVESVTPSQVLPSGSTIQLSAPVSGLEPLTYQWYFNASNAISGARTPWLTLPTVQLPDSGTYTLVASNAFGMVTSPPVVLTVTNMPPLVLTPPASRSAGVGATVDFSAVVDGSFPRTYQWLFNGTESIAGATGASLRLVNVQPSQSGTYSLAITNAYGSVTSAPAILQVQPPVVGEPTEAALRSAIAHGGTVVFACDGTISLANTIVITNQTVLDATGHQVAISGTNVRLFYVNSNVTFGTRNLSLAGGGSTMGGGIYNDGGTLSLLDTMFTTNRATNGLVWPMDVMTNAGRGGAIFNQGGVINATNCRFSGNLATTESVPQSAGALGGAICSPAGRVNLDRCVFIGNKAQGGPTTADFPGYGSQAPCPGRGGAVYSAGELSVNQCTFSQNLAGGGSPYTWEKPGAPGLGGGIYNAGLMAATGSLFLSNSVVGGAGMPGASSMPGFGLPGTPGGFGGPGLGAALFNSATASIVNSTLAGNLATGGRGGDGGAGSYYYAHGGIVVYTPGGYGGVGGDAFGIICSTNGTLNVTNCTIARNASVGGPPGLSGRNGDGSSGGYPSAGGLPGAALVLSNTAALNTIISANSPSNCVGLITDRGHNISSDASCGFLAGVSWNNVDPLLGALGDNGGPTLTFPLLAGSPAIDKGDIPGTPPVDQRGFPRPIGAGPDIGAYEYGSPALLSASVRVGGQVDILVYAVPQQTCRLFSSPDLVAWLPIATNQIPPSGVALFHDQAGGSTARFYRAVLPY